MGDFQRLQVWQKAKNLAIDIYKVTGNTRFSSDFGLLEIRSAEQELV